MRQSIGNQFFRDSVDNSRQQPESMRKTFWIGLAIILVVAVSAVVWTYWASSVREREFEANLGKRLELLAGSQVQLVEALLETSIEQANRVINAEVFKLYAAEVDLIEDDVSWLVAGNLPGKEPLKGNLSDLSEQLPMMQNLLIEFTRISGFVAGRVVNRNGTVFISTDAATTPLRSGQAEHVKTALQSAKPTFGAIRYQESGLVLDTFLPIFPPEASGLEQKPVAVLLLTKVVGKHFDEIRNSSLLEKGEQIRWIQKIDIKYEEIVPWLPGQMQVLSGGVSLEVDEGLTFASRSSLGGDRRVYSRAMTIPGPSWWVVVEADYSIVRETLRGERRSMLSIAGLLVLIFAVTFGAVWAALVSQQDRRVAHHFKRLAAEIESQRQLLDQINNNIADYISLKDLKGHYQYVNPAFAKAVGREPQEIVGLDAEAVFGFDTAKRLEHSEQQVLAGSGPVTFEETVFLQSSQHHLLISKAPIRDSDGKVSGIVSVSRDITSMVEVQKRQEQATHKTVEALVRAIELTDPYLAGHSRLVSALGVEVAKALNASNVDTATVETAAHLSQVGKLFVDRKLLSKVDPLTAEEKREMESHVDHAAKVLKGIDFGLPIFEAIYQMNEHLNGTGYPKQLTGDAIELPARILGVVNSFCAMVEPRSYRAARPVEEALDIITSEKDGYDEQVIAALGEVVNSAIGEKLLVRHMES
ncbi:MAG: hypothetical protein C0616_05230 [Desulfuromonas sp.]|nr:MAG: hypothetical protein C0616_05230 [Desulfuromonas sp.]